MSSLVLLSPALLTPPDDVLAGGPSFWSSDLSTTTMLTREDLVEWTLLFLKIIVKWHFKINVKFLCATLPPEWWVCAFSHMISQSHSFLLVSSPQQHLPYCDVSLITSLTVSQVNPLNATGANMHQVPMLTGNYRTERVKSAQLIWSASTTMMDTTDTTCLLCKLSYVVMQSNQTVRMYSRPYNSLWHFPRFSLYII